MKAEHATLLAEAERHKVERYELQAVRAELEAQKKVIEEHDAALKVKAERLKEARLNPNPSGPFQRNRANIEKK